MRWTSAEHVSCFFEREGRHFRFVWALLGCQLLKYMVVNYTHARCMKWSWTRYSLSYCSLVSMFLSLAKCFLLLRAALPVACSSDLRLKWHLLSWHCSKTKMFCFTGDYGATFTGSNEVRLCEKKTYDPPFSSCEIYHLKKYMEKPEEPS